MSQPKVAHGAPEGPGCRSPPTDAAAYAIATTDTMTVLDWVPVEVLIDVFQRLDISSALSLAATSRRFAEIYVSHRASIVLRIVEEEFSPLDGLLQVVKASPADLSVPWGTWLNKRVRHKATILCPGGQLPEHCSDNIAATKISCADVQIDDADIDRVLAVCRVVRGWERIYPQHRFASAPLMTRSLSARENKRLRRAIYHWMRYAYYFHGDLPFPEQQYKPLGRDVRVNQLRVLPNSELGELSDLYRTVNDILEFVVCPSIEQVLISSDYKIPTQDAERIGWGTADEAVIVTSTMCKLSPAELLHYIDNRHWYSKASLVQDIRQRHPHIEQSIETLSGALGCLANERWKHVKEKRPDVPLWPLRKDPEASRHYYLPVGARCFEVVGTYDGGILDWSDAATETWLAKVGEMTGMGLDWRPYNRPTTTNQD